MPTSNSTTRLQIETLQHWIRRERFEENAGHLFLSAKVAGPSGMGESPNQWHSFFLRKDSRWGCAIQRSMLCLLLVTLWQQGLSHVLQNASVSEKHQVHLILKQRNYAETLARACLETKEHHQLLNEEDRAEQIRLHYI